VDSPAQEVYYSNPISTMVGADALVRFNFGDYTLLFQPYYGVSRGEQALVPQEVVGGVPKLTCDQLMNCTWGPSPSGTVAYADFTADGLTGVNLSFGSDVFTVRAGYLQTW